MLRSWGTGVAMAGGGPRFLSLVVFLGLPSSFPESLLRFPQPIARSVGFEDMYSMGQPIEQGSGEPFAAHHLDPVLEGQVGGDDQAGGGLVIAGVWIQCGHEAGAGVPPPGAMSSHQDTRDGGKATSETASTA